MIDLLASRDPPVRLSRIRDLARPGPCGPSHRKTITGQKRGAAARSGRGGLGRPPGGGTDCRTPVGVRCACPLCRGPFIPTEFFFAPAAPTRPILEGAPPLQPRQGAPPPGPPSAPKGPRPQTPDGLDDAGRRRESAASSSNAGRAERSGPASPQGARGTARPAPDGRSSRSQRQPPRPKRSPAGSGAEPQGLFEFSLLRDRVGWAGGRTPLPAPPTEYTPPARPPASHTPSRRPRPSQPPSACTQSCPRQQ